MLATLPESTVTLNKMHTSFNYKISLFLLLSFISHALIGQNSFSARIDSLIQSHTQKPFNGVIMVSQNGKKVYSKIQGFADIEKKSLLQPESQFVLASLSKQITAVLVLQEVDKGHLKLTDTIRNYLPLLKEPWADSVTVHQLLNHTSGIVGANKSLAFKPGTQFAYSASYTYQLLRQIVETASNKTYPGLASELFRRCTMKNTTTPGAYKTGNLVSSYSAHKSILQKKELNLEALEVIAPGAGLISTAEDLVAWNEQLHNGKLLSKSSYKQMTTSWATRKHPVWGEVGYGYGLQINQKDGLLEISHSGSHNIYYSINFYYPATKTSVLVFSNTDWYAEEDPSRSFYFHSHIQRIIRENELMRKK